MPEWKNVESPTMPTTFRVSAVTAPRFGLLHAVRHGDARAHAEDRVDALQRRKHAEGVAADVAGDGHVELAQRVEDAPVRAGGTENGRPGGQIGVRGAGAAARRAGRARVAQRAPGEPVRGKLPDAGHEAAALAGNAQRADVLLQDRIELFDDDEPLHPRGELADQLVGNGQTQPIFRTDASGASSRTYW